MNHNLQETPIKKIMNYEMKLLLVDRFNPVLLSVSVSSRRRQACLSFPCHLSKRVGHPVPMVGFFLVSVIKQSSQTSYTGLNKLYEWKTMFFP